MQQVVPELMGEREADSSCRLDLIVVANLPLALAWMFYKHPLKARSYQRFHAGNWFARESLTRVLKRKFFHIHWKAFRPQNLVQQ